MANGIDLAAVAQVCRVVKGFIVFPAVIFGVQSVFAVFARADIETAITAFAAWTLSLCVFSAAFMVSALIAEALFGASFAIRGDVCCKRCGTVQHITHTRCTKCRFLIGVPPEASVTFRLSMFAFALAEVCWYGVTLG
jgi:hypothetical protein